MAWAHAQDLGPRSAASVSLTPGWLRSEMMLDAFGVGEANWRDATAQVPHFVISETPRFVGRAVAAMAADPERARWNGRSVSSGELAAVYGFTDLDGSRPDAWRYIVEVAGGRHAGRRDGIPLDVAGGRSIDHTQGAPSGPPPPAAPTAWSSCCTATAPTATT